MTDLELAKAELRRLERMVEAQSTRVTHLERIICANVHPINGHPGVVPRVVSGRLSPRLQRQFAR